MDQQQESNDGGATEFSGFPAVGASDRNAAPLPRRRVLRALPGVAMGVLALAGLAACGGEGDEEDEEDD